MRTSSNYSPGFASYRFEYLEHIDVVADAAGIDTPAVRMMYLAKLTALEQTLKHLESVGIEATVVFHGKEEGARLSSDVTVECSNAHFRKVLDVVTKRFCCYPAIC
jgi:hypothetical protein